jgi:hypothetical protein
MRSLRILLIGLAGLLVLAARRESSGGSDTKAPAGALPADTEYSGTSDDFLTGDPEPAGANLTRRHVGS